MSKNNKLLTAIFVFVVVCVVGYALFSDTITIEGSATASGNFEIISTCDVGDTYNALGSIEGGYKNDTCSLTENGVAINTFLEYPTANRSFTIFLKNTGTIDAVIDTENDIEISTTARCPIDNNGEFNNSCSLMYEDFFHPWYNTPKINGIIRNSVYYPITDETEIIVKPGESLVSVINIVWHEERTAERFNGVTYGYGLKILYNFNQATVK